MEWLTDELNGHGSHCNFQSGIEAADKDVEAFREGCVERRLRARCSVRRMWNCSWRLPVRRVYWEKDCWAVSTKSLIYFNHILSQETYCWAIDSVLSIQIYLGQMKTSCTRTTSGLTSRLSSPIQLTRAYPSYPTRVRGATSPPCRFQRRRPLLRRLHPGLDTHNVFLNCWAYILRRIRLALRTWCREGFRLTPVQVQVWVGQACRQSESKRYHITLRLEGRSFTSRTLRLSLTSVEHCQEGCHID